MKKIMANVWEIINRKNISLDKRVLEAIAEKYDIPKATRPEFVEEILVCSQSVEQRQFLNKVLRLSGLAIFQTIGYWSITAVVLPEIFQQKLSLNLNKPAIIVALIVLNILAVFALFYLGKPLDKPRTFKEELQIAEKQIKPIIDDFMSR